MKLPSKKDWGSYEDDFDLKDLYKLFFGKRIEDVYYYFKDHAYISRADELLYASKKVFQYYIYAFVLYLESDMGCDDDEAKEVFLRLLVDREKKDKGSVCSIYFNKVNVDYSDANTQAFEISIESIANRIYKDYIAGKIDNELYEDIPYLVQEIHKLCGVKNEENKS